jgi:hypothetical protein
MKQYDISKLDIFSIPDLKRGELANIHSVMLFLYNKLNDNPEVSFKYSELTWLNYNSVQKIIAKLYSLELIDMIQSPTKHKPTVIQLKTNAELQYILNKRKRIEFEKYKNIRFTENHLKEVIGCVNLSEHFITKQIPSWIRNVNSKAWDLYRFLAIVKIASYFNCDERVKTFSVNKYTAKRFPFNKTIGKLYEKIPDHRKEIVYNQFQNTLEHHRIKHNKSFTDMIIKYLNEIKKEVSSDTSFQNDASI